MKTLVFEVEMEEGIVEGNFFGEVKKKKEKCKGMVYIGFWICEGVVIKVDERGFCVNEGA